MLLQLQLWHGEEPKSTLENSTHCWWRSFITNSARHQARAVKRSRRPTNSQPSAMTLNEQIALRYSVFGIGGFLGKEDVWFCPLSQSKQVGTDVRPNTFSVLILVLLVLWSLIGHREDLFQRETISKQLANCFSWCVNVSSLKRKAPLQLRFEFLFSNRENVTQSKNWSLLIWSIRNWCEIRPYSVDCYFSNSNFVYPPLSWFKRVALPFFVRSAFHGGKSWAAVKYEKSSTNFLLHTLL